jgi:UDP-glucuronate 4-epimerase
MIDQGETIPMFGDGSSKRDYTYIDDLVDGILAALDRPLGYEVINLGEEETITLQDLIRLIEKTLEKEAKIERLPDQPGDVPVTYADISKARKLLDYDPRVKIREGIPKFIEWYRQHKKEKINK